MMVEEPVKKKNKTIKPLKITTRYDEYKTVVKKFKINQKKHLQRTKANGKNVDIKRDVLWKKPAVQTKETIEENWTKKAWWFVVE